MKFYHFLIALIAACLVLVIILSMLFESPDPLSIHVREIGNCTYATDSGASDLVLTHYDNLLFLLKKFNSEIKIKNTNKFTLEEGFIPILIRVCDRVKDFEKVIKAWRNVKGIEKTIIVISHDNFSADMAAVADSIDFCQYVQLIHPYSANAFRDRFPGEDPNLGEPDSFGHYRDYHTTLKHHFWWLLHESFSKLFPNSDEIAFFEEDHLVSSDIYLLMKKVVLIKNRICADCLGITFEGESKEIKPELFDELYTTLYYSLLTPNYGLTIARSAFKKINQNKEKFCTHDDYNWDLTLTSLGAGNIIPKKTLRIAFPHVVHLGVCGLHKPDVDCDNRNQYVQTMAKLIHNYLSNKNILDISFKMADAASLELKDRSGWGGWSDTRDHKLCLSIAAISN